MFQEIPTFYVKINHQDRVNSLMKQYDDIRGQKLSIETIHEICMLMRLLDQEKVSPLLYFTWCIVGVPKEEYLASYRLEQIATQNFLTMPISILNIVQEVITQPNKYIPGMPIEALHVLFDPFNIEYQNWDEYDILMKSFEDKHLDDIRYDYYITIIWHV